MKRRSRQTLVLWMTSVSLVGIAWAAWVNSPPRIVYNPSASVPRGWYAIVPVTQLHTRDLVLTQLPAPIARFAADRGYVPLTVPLLKRIAALDGQEVCVVDGVIRIDGTETARARHRDGLGRSLSAWRDCRVMRADELFFLNLDHEGSFDSRYFGPLPRAAVIGQAIPLWTW